MAGPVSVVTVAPNARLAVLNSNDLRTHNVESGRRINLWLLFRILGRPRSNSRATLCRSRPLV